MLCKISFVSLIFETKEKTMFIYPTSKGHHVLDTELAVPKAVVPTIAHFQEDDEILPQEDEEDGKSDPFIQACDEEELYYDDFLDFYCGQHVHDNERLNT